MTLSLRRTVYDGWDAFSHIRNRLITQVLMPRYRLVTSALVALAAAFASSSPTVFAQTTPTSEPPASFTLDNGLQVVVIVLAAAGASCDILD